MCVCVCDCVCVCVTVCVYIIMCRHKRSKMDQGNIIGVVCGVSIVGEMTTLFTLCTKDFFRKNQKFLEKM